MSVRIPCKIILLTLFISFHIFLDLGVAESFPFRDLAVGQHLPGGSIVNGTDQTTFPLARLQGHPAVLLFWGGDIEMKKARAIAALAELQGLAPFLAERQIAFKVINAQGDTSDIIDEVVAASGLMAPNYLDPDQKLYGEFGVFIMPAVLLVDKEGVVVAGMGYSRDMTTNLKGEIQVLLGEKTREQIAAELHPVMVQKTKEEKDANRSLSMGGVLVRKGQLDEAKREFQAAVLRNPKLADAFIELGCVEFQLGALEESVRNLEIGLELKPDSLRGEICFAQTTAAQGDVDTALEDLQAMLFRNGRSAELHYVLGTLYEKKEAWVKAAGEFRKSYELLLRSTLLQE